MSLGPWVAWAYITFHIQEPRKGKIRPMSLPQIVNHDNADKFPEYLHWASFFVQNIHFIWERFFFFLKISQYWTEPAFM